MNQIQATKLAVESMQKEIRSLAQQANLFDIYQLDTPGTVSASKRRKQLKEAVKILKGE